MVDIFIELEKPSWSSEDISLLCKKVEHFVDRLELIFDCEGKHTVRITFHEKINYEKEDGDG